MRVGFLFAVSFFLFLKSLYLFVVQIDMVFKLFAILQMYEFSSKSQRSRCRDGRVKRCLRYCKCTSFQANHNTAHHLVVHSRVVCDTANVRVFKQITTEIKRQFAQSVLFAILQMYEFSSKSQQCPQPPCYGACCLRYCKCTSFQANHNGNSTFSVQSIVVCDTANVRVFVTIQRY